MIAARFALLVMALILLPGAASAAGGKLELTVVDAESGESLPCRLHLKNAANRPQQVAKLPFFHDHFVVPGQVTLKLPKGSYTFVIERGPEYVVRSGHFTIDDFADDKKQVDLKRFVDMAKQGWWSGDLHVHRSAKDIEDLMLADDLHVAQLVSWTVKKNEWKTGSLPRQPLVKFDGNRFYQLLAGEFDKDGSDLLFLNLKAPLDLTAAGPPASPLSLALQAKQETNAWVAVEKPFSWDLPLLLAHNAVDSIDLANCHMQRQKMQADEAGGKPRDVKKLPPPLGNGMWSQEIYYRVLNAGLRIPPAAGSGSGEAANPVGYNRTYVFTGEEKLTYDAWWQGLREGKVVVTNGPLMRSLVAGKLPGHVFTAPAGGEVSLDAVIDLSTRDPLTYIEIVKDGRTLQSIRVEDWAKNGTLPAIVFQDSGWFLIRAVTDVAQTYRFASTGPYYVEIGGQPKVSKGAARFFLDWLEERAAKLKPTDLAAKQYATARQFWQAQVERATTP